MSEPANLRELLTVPVDLLDQGDDAIHDFLERRQEQRQEEEAKERAKKEREQKERKEREHQLERERMAKEMKEVNRIFQDKATLLMRSEPPSMMFAQPLVRANGMSLLVGPPGHGKSALAAHALYSVATGVTTALTPLVSPRPAIALLTESREDYIERLSALENHHGKPWPRHLRLVPEDKLPNLLDDNEYLEFVDTLWMLLEDLGMSEPPFIVIDSLRQFTQMGDSLVHDETAEPLMRRLCELQREFHSSVLLVHGANDENKPYGAKVLQYQPEIWSVIKKKGSEATIRNGKNRGGVPGSFRVRFHSLSDDAFILVPASGERKAKAGKKDASPSKLEKLHAYVVEIYGEHDFGFNKLHDRINQDQIKKGSRRIGREPLRKLLVEGINLGLFVQPMERGPYRAVLKSGSLPSIKTTKTSTG